MKKCIDKAAIGNILHKLWKKDTGFENIDIVQIAYNRALQDVQCEIDTFEVQEEPVSEDKMTISKEWFEHCKKSWYNEGYIDGEYNRDRQFEEPVSNDLGKAAEQDVCEVVNECSSTGIPNDHISSWVQDAMINEFIHGAKWKAENLWKHADGYDLPKIGREVIALLDNGKVVFAHRPPEYWDGKDIITGKVTRYYPKTYGKGGWNIPNIKWWLDCLLPNLEED